MFDLVIINGNVNFGDMSKSSKCNIGITDEKISYIGGESGILDFLMHNRDLGAMQPQK